MSPAQPRGPYRCTAAIMPAAGVSEGCSADANSAAHRASRAAGGLGGRGVLACMGQLLSVVVRGRARGGTGGSGIA
jgi:hypothetical protein